MRLCTKCKDYREPFHFHKNYRGTYRDNLDSWCRECNQKYKKKAYSIKGNYSERARAELYSVMYTKDQNNQQLTKDDIFDIYYENIYLQKPIRKYELASMDERKIRANAISWFELAIVRLIKSGLIGLTFNQKPQERLNNETGKQGHGISD